MFPYGQIFLFVSLLIEIQSGVLLIAPFSPTMGQETAKRRARRQTAPPKPKQVGGFQSVPDESKSIPKLENELEFSKWYNEVEDGLLEASYGEYQYGPSRPHTSVLWLTMFEIRSCLDELQMSKSHLDSLLSDTSSTLDLLSSLSKSFNAVELQTSNFQKHCEGLLSAQKRDSDLAVDIQENLQYYDFLDPASRRLNAPGAGNTVRSREFSDMLRRLDECLDYMERHVSALLRS